MDSKTPSVSVIIAVYEKPGFLNKIFLSLQNQTFQDFEVIIADDGSGSSIADVVRKYKNRFSFPVKHLWHENKGFRKTIIINRAASLASSQYLVFIDGDSILHHRFLEFHNKRKKTGRVLSGRRVKFSKTLSRKITDNDVISKKIEKWSFSRSNCLKPGFKHGIFIPGMFLLRNFKRKDYKIVGANFSLHKSDFIKINGYDERIIGRGLEDDNLYKRFRLADMDICSVVFEALQYHLYHEADPVPHSEETIRTFKKNVKKAVTPFGIYKNRVQ